MKTSTRRNSYRRRERLVSYMLWVRTQPCIVTTMGVFNHAAFVQPPHMSGCFGGVQADHAGARALGRKACDSTCIPICRNHHDQRTNGWGLFSGFTLIEKRAWKIDAIEHTQARARDQKVDVPVEVVSRHGVVT